MVSKVARTTLKNEQRLEVLEYKNQNPKASQAIVADWVKTKFDLNVHPTTIGRLLKRKDDLEGDSSTKRFRTVRYPNLENVLSEWVIQHQAHVTLSDTILIEKAKYFAQQLDIPTGQFKFSAGWLSKFKKRHGIAKIKLHGEDASADHTAAATAIPELRGMLMEYDLRDIYNMDETVLF